MHRLNALMCGFSPFDNSFWADRSRGVALAVLQDRLSQVHSLVGMFQSTLERIYKTLFLLDNAPTGLFPLLNAFRHGTRGVEKFVRDQLVAGAVAALAFVRVCHPDIDLEEVSTRLPTTREDARVLMAEHYAAAAWPARKIIRKVELETAYELRRRQQGVQG